MDEKKNKLTAKEIWGYGIGIFGQTAIYVLVSGYLLFFFTDVAKINAAVVGTLFLVSKIWDALDDPIQGILADRTRTKWGRYRPWLLITPFLTSITTVLLFTIPNLSESATIVYMYITFIAYGIFYSAYDIPYFSLIPALTSDQQERTRVVMAPKIMGFLGAMIVSIGAIPLVKILGGGNDAAGFQLLAIILSVVFIITGLIGFFSTTERVSPPVRKGEKFKESLQVITKNGPLMVLVLATLIFAGGASIRGGVSVFYFKYYIGDELLVSVNSLASAVVTLISMFFAPMVAKRLGKRKTYILGAGIMVLNQLLSYLIPPSQPMLFIALNAISGFGFGIFNVVVTSMLADTVEYAEWKIGKRSESIVFSLSAFINKVSGAIGTSIVAFALAAVNFVPDVTQTPESIQGIRMLVSIWPAAIAGLALILILFYKIDEKKYAEMVKDIEARKKADLEEA